MDHQPDPPLRKPRSTNADYRWTPPKAYAFLDALALHGKVAVAARSVGMTRQSAYRLRERIPVVAEGWARAQAIGRERRLARGRPTLRAGQGDTFEGAR